MPTLPPLCPADPTDGTDALAYALHYDDRQRVHHADHAMARMTAGPLISHLKRSGFVLMRKAPGAAPTTTIMPSLIG